MAPPRKTLTLREAAALIGARLVGDGEAVVTGMAPLGDAGPDQVTFLANPRYRKALAGSRAAAVVIGAEEPDLPLAQLVVDAPYYAYALLMGHFYGRPHEPAGVSPDARVDGRARLGKDPNVAAHVSVGPDTVIGDRVTLHPGVRVGAGCVLGEDVTLHPNVVVYDGCRLGNRVIAQAGCVIGGDGFGFATHQGVHHKIPHAGSVVIADDVELGANASVDRGVMGDTVIGAGTKVDSLVQVAHNVRIGRGCLIAAQVGISGSSVLGDYVVMGGQSGVSGHVTIGSRVIIAARAGVTKDIADGQTVSGFPAVPHRQEMKTQAAVGRLPELRERVRRLERRVEPEAPDTHT